MNEGAIDRAVAGAGRPLTPEQEEVVHRCATSGSGVQVIEALAGTGKTYTAGVLRAVFEDAGYRVLGLAPTGRGARELTEEAGIVAVTIDRALVEVERLGATFPRRSVIVLDEAGMAPTRATAKVLELAAAAEAKVIAIGDSGQLPSVLAGGWLRAVGERVGTLRLTEVMRQRDPRERRALAALHDGAPERYLEWAESDGRIEVTTANELQRRAVAQWKEDAAEHGPAQAVMISRNNQRRDALNDAAREVRKEEGRLGPERTFGQLTVAVGDRVICRNNDSRVGVDNGTRGTVRHVDDDKVVLETDSGLVRELPAGYVADHVELAYCLTGHGMQGGTVERAVVVGSPDDMTSGWSYTALSRARGETLLLIADNGSKKLGRDEMAPEERLPAPHQRELFARLARRMHERDDEDLAIERLLPAGREDDRELLAERQLAGERLEERGAVRAEPVKPAPSLSRLMELRDQLSRLRVALSALPIRYLTRFDELDADERDLAAQRDKHAGQFVALGEPQRRLGRVHDPHADERSFLASVLELDDRGLAEIRAERERLHRELGAPDQVRSERDGIERAIGEASREYEQTRDVLVSRELEREPDWLVAALGASPPGERDLEVWERAATEVARYRFDHDVVDHRKPLGPPLPADHEEYRDWQVAWNALDRAQRQLGVEVERQGHGLDIGLG